MEVVVDTRDGRGVGEGEEGIPNAPKRKGAGNWPEDARPSTSTLGTGLLSALLFSRHTEFRGIRVTPTHPWRP